MGRQKKEKQGGRGWAGMNARAKDMVEGESSGRNEPEPHGEQRSCRYCTVACSAEAPAD